VQQRVAEELKVPLSRVYGVVTFYSFFTMKPRGKHTIRTCLGTACYVLGGKGIAETITRELKVNHGDTTADRLFTFEVVRCIGACGLAPAVVVDEVVHGKVKASNIMQILSKFS
jgi:NADH:ubiquinone oxidoreductase subunit E